MHSLSTGEHEPILLEAPHVKAGSVHAVKTRLLHPVLTSTSAQAADLSPSGAASAPSEPSETPAPAEAGPSQPTQKNTTAPPDYWPRKWLSNAPTPNAPTVVPYPESAPSDQKEGWVILELFISASGQVDRVEVLSSQAPDEFIASARQTFGQSTFSPGLKDNVPVPSRIKIEVRFDQR